MNIIITKMSDDLQPGDLLATSDSFEHIVELIEPESGYRRITLRGVADTYLVKDYTPVATYVRPDRHN